jgi:hypothetical protein
MRLENVAVWDEWRILGDKRSVFAIEVARRAVKQ